jgi:hypothetical protein
MANATTSRYLLESILDQGIRNTNFFNGRILTADDLRTEQDANRQQHEQLGQAIGAGIVNGLDGDWSFCFTLLSQRNRRLGLEWSVRERGEAGSR